MTSRPSLGVHQRPPQHKLSAPALSTQRPPGAHHQRPLSHAHPQQPPYPPSSPVRRDPALYDHSSPDLSDVSLAPRLAAQRRGGSRLKLELSHDAIAFSPVLVESPSAVADPSKPFTPSRVIPTADSSDLGDMSPHLSAHQQPLSVEVDAPLPMPRRPPPFALAPTAAVAAAAPSSREMPPPPAANPARRDARPKPFAVEPPVAAPRFSKLSGSSAASKPGAALGPPPKTGYADFFPWAGNHPEDQWSDLVIRQGYYDKPLFPNTETQSAKHVLYPALKHKTGLTALSSVFTAVLGQRRHNGQITAPSTFKPPPRVTLTDTKREAWLRDLANPAISLRRLSRTIPHGIRGRVLLDQCLAKRVPTDRAVWLIKCVGANELRATKRKNVSSLVLGGGEARWIKDWTVAVEQFIEHVYFAFDEDDWKAKVHYTTRLAAHLYAEHLLDRDHYSEWLVANLESSPEARLPMWILLTRLYWKDLLRMRKYGRRLVAALISHHSLIYNHPDKDILRPLLKDLTECIHSLMLTSPENFVSPSTWSKHRDTIRACLPAGDEARHNAFAAISLRNEQLAVSANRSQPAARHILVRMLDGTLQAPMPPELPAQCWGISKDKDALARTLLEWCTSLYRPGLAKVYVASRMLQHWSALGLDATMAVLAFLDTDACREAATRRSLYHLVSELVRSGAFSVPRYLQWLVARGGIRNPDDISEAGPGPIRLLVEIPPHALTPSQRELRGGILRRASFSVADEAQDAELAFRHLKHTLGMPLDPDDPLLLQHRRPLSLKKLAAKIASAGRALKAEIGCWLRASFAAHAQEKEAAGGGQAPDVSPSLFHAVRVVLEAAEDFAMLGDILKTLAKCSAVEVLAAVADTVNRHFCIFSALGDTQPLFRDLLQRLRVAIQEQNAALRPLLASLVSLAPRIPGMEDLASQLKKDLALNDRQNPVDMCSPVSDNNVVVRFQDDAAELHDEIEKLLAGGSSLDRNTMDRLFQTVVQRLHACWDKAPGKQRAYSSLLGRLRLFNAQHFDGLMVKWLIFLRTLANRPSILRIFPLLVSVGCLDMASVLATTADLPASQAAGPARPPPGASAAAAAAPQVVQLTYRTRYMQEVLQLIAVPLRQDDLLTADEVYRFGILQDQAIRESPKEVLNLVFLAAAEYWFAREQNDLEALPLESASVQQDLLELLKRLVLRDPAGVARALGGVQTACQPVGGWIDNLTTRLLIPTANADTHVMFDRVLELTNEFTLPFCQVKLALSLRSSDQAGGQDAAAPERQQSHVELFANAMDKAIGAGNMSWVGMLSYLSPDITQHLRLRAQNRFLDLLPSERSQPPSDPALLAQSLLMAENLLAVLDAILRGSPSGARQVPLPPSTVDKLVDLWKLLDAPGTDDNDNDSSDVASPSFSSPVSALTKCAVLVHWLPLALNYVTLHAHSLDSSKPASEVRAKLLVACAGLMHVLDAFHLPAEPGVMEMLASAAMPGPAASSSPAAAAAAAQSLSRRVFDLSCLLVDNLTEDARAACVRAVREAAGGDRRLAYLFSFGAAVPSAGAAGGGNGSDAPYESTSLVLVHRDATNLASGGGGGGGGNRGGAGGSGGALFSGLLGTPPALWGLDRGNQAGERISAFQYRRWETLGEPTPNVGENDTAIGLGLFKARRVQ
ncbi:hypothetical protein VTJ83DRAFT_1808 [Remersonia thermophila]|uniref:Mediator of RNA polymerase II transcription subunit 12 n=1 Tax=Remersonia thermophila TaxID=72144 RepID=A0ABR4DJ89_9PEZI